VSQGGPSIFMILRTKKIEGLDRLK
jgi:hypothetical protein